MNITDITTFEDRALYDAFMAEMEKSGYDLVSFGQALKYYREVAGYSQKQLAPLLGMKWSSTLSGWESRAVAPNKPHQLELAANLLNVPLDDLVEGRIQRPTQEIELELRRLHRVYAPSLEPDEGLVILREYGGLPRDSRVEARHYLEYLKWRNKQQNVVRIAEHREEHDSKREAR